MILDEEFFKEAKEKYDASKVNAVARHALCKNKMMNLVKVNEQTEFVQNRFSIDLKTLPVTNQKSSGRCWIFAGCNVLREIVAKKYKLENFEVSQNYVAFYDKLEKCNYFFESIISLYYDKPEGFERVYDFILNNGIEDGGQWDLFVNIINKYGICPKDAFPETFQSSNTRDINNLLNRYIRKFAFEIREISIDNAKLKQREFMENIYKILCSSFGIPPKTFSFEYVDKDKNYNKIYDLNPMKFRDEIIGVNLNDYISIINSPTQDKPFYNPYTVNYLGNVVEGNKVLYLNEEMNRFKDLVVSQLKDGEPVWFGSDCSKDSDRDEGLWDDKSLNLDLLFDIDSSLSKEGMLNTRDSAMNHAMVITGVNLEDGKPTKWKIENSWGDDVAKKGYYVATDSWFDKYVYQAVINKKYLSDFERKDLTKEKIELAPWDPMGTLA